MNIQVVANEEDQDSTQRGENEAGRMKPLVPGAKNDVSDSAAQERPNDAEHDCPHETQMNVHQ
jgi:hypothetical protein